MNLFATSPQWLTFALVVVLLAAAIQDAFRLKISNIFVAAVLLMAVAAMLLSNLELRLWQNLASFALVLCVGTLLFSKGMLGGGDVKLLAAVVLWADAATALKLIAAIFICGGLLAIVMLGLRMVAPASGAKRSKALTAKSGIPYGVAIAAGSILIIGASGRMAGT